MGRTSERAEKEEWTKIAAWDKKPLKGRIHMGRRGQATQGMGEAHARVRS
jgi:hypothetical protein